MARSDRCVVASNAGISRTATPVLDLRTLREALLKNLYSHISYGFGEPKLKTIGVFDAVSSLVRDRCQHSNSQRFCMVKPLSSHWQSFTPDFQGKLLLEFMAMDNISTRIVEMDTFAKSPVAAVWYTTPDPYGCRKFKGVAAKIQLQRL
jgi:hypothetical protein